MLPSFRHAPPVRTLRPDAGPYTLRVRDELAQSLRAFGWVQPASGREPLGRGGATGVSALRSGGTGPGFLGGPSLAEQSKNSTDHDWLLQCLELMRRRNPQHQRHIALSWSAQVTVQHYLNTHKRLMKKFRFQCQSISTVMDRARIALQKAMSRQH
jgi:hypothetical protein